MIAMTNSLAFPNLFDVVHNHVGVLEGNTSIVNRVRLLIKTEPTELYNNPDFGAGLKRYLWQYNTSNQKAIIHDRIKEQIRLHEPCCDADSTQYADGLKFTESDSFISDTTDINKLKMTVLLKTIYNDDVEVTLDGN